MADGFYLTLMIGPVIPAPVSREIIDALTSVEVTANTDGPSVFQLTFNLGTRSPLHTLFLVSSGASVPLIRVVVAITVNGTSEVLIDGVMTHHQVTPGTDAGHATMTITGEDLSRIMDYVDLSGIPYPAVPDFASVLLILAKYIPFGVIPEVIPSPLLDIPLPVEEILRQQGTDLKYIKYLARLSGYVFYLEPGPSPGTSIAYWGPDIKVGQPQPALNINMDAHTNVESLTVTYDSEKKTLPVLYIQNETTGLTIPIPVPDITPFNPPLGLVPAIPKKILPIRGMANKSMIRAALIGLAKAATSSEVVRAEGSLDTVRYGHVLRPHKLVGVRGAGAAFDGLYYVRSVTHRIKRGEYKQNFTLTRNGLVSTVGKVTV